MPSAFRLEISDFLVVMPKLGIYTTLELYKLAFLINQNKWLEFKKTEKNHVLRFRDVEYAFLLYESFLPYSIQKVYLMGTHSIDDNNAEKSDSFYLEKPTKLPVTRDKNLPDVLMLFDTNEKEARLHEWIMRLRTLSGVLSVREFVPSNPKDEINLLID